MGSGWRVQHDLSCHVYGSGASEMLVMVRFSSFEDLRCQVDFLGCPRSAKHVPSWLLAPGAWLLAHGPWLSWLLAHASRYLRVVLGCWAAGAQ